MISRRLRRALRHSTLRKTLGSRLATLAADSRVAAAVQALRSQRSGEPAGSRNVTHPEPPEAASDAPIHRYVTATSGVVRALSHARLTQAFTSLTTTLGRVGGRSRVSAWLRSGYQHVKTASLYRWLTAEPDPDVIVIDLRETLTVGPWLAALDRGLRWLVPAAATSGLIRGVRRSHRLLKRRPVQVGSLLLGGLAAAIASASVLSNSPSRTSLVGALVLAIIALLGSRVTWSWADLQATRGYQYIKAALEPPEPPAEIPPEPTDDEASTSSSDSPDRAS